MKEKNLMVDDCMLDEVSGKIKKTISIQKFDDTKILADTDDKLAEILLLKCYDINDIHYKR